VPDVGPHEFTFTLALAHEPRFDSMLAELAGAVLRHVGYGPAAVTELSGTIRQALSGVLADRGGECQVAFRAHDGALHIELRSTAGAEWRTSRPLP
jgi:hypothetical protein